jgi:hypothetical protein
MRPSLHVIPSGEQSMVNWQPIETAPRDGAFLVTDGTYIAEVFGKRQGGGFPTTTDGYLFEDATHWMPNPDFPSDADGQ